MKEQYSNKMSLSKKEFVETEIEHLRNQLNYDLAQPWGKDAEMLSDGILRQMAEDTWKIEQS